MCSSGVPAPLEPIAYSKWPCTLTVEDRLMRMLSVIAAAGAVVATASLSFAQPQAPASPSRAPLEAPECQRGALPTPGNRKRPAR
jgi:hypothetical protein